MSSDTRRPDDGTNGNGTSTKDIPAARAVTTIVSRGDRGSTAGSSPELYLDLEHGDERNTIGIGWSHDELEQLLDRATGDDILFSFDRDELQLVFDDVEAHGFRERALVFTVAVAGALGSGSRSQTLHRPSSAVPTVPLRSRRCKNWRPTRPAEFTSNVHTPGMQIDPVESTASTPAVGVKTTGNGSDSEFLGVNTQDVTDALIAGGVLLAIAGATFAGTRRPGSARPA